MNPYVLSQEADKDVEEVYAYGKHRFGATQALTYLLGLQQQMEHLARLPDMGKHRPEIKEGLFSMPYNSHIIFYRKLPGYIRIVRVLYGGRDLRKFLG